MVAPCEPFPMLADVVPDREPDLLLVGGGLANGLLAWRLSQLRPELDVRIVESESALGGMHTWSFFETDLTPDQRDWLEPLIAYRWPGYAVRFPAHSRRLAAGYCSVTSAWLPNPDLDFTVGTGAAAKRGRVFPDVEQIVPLGTQLLYVRDGVGVSSGDLSVIMQGEGVTR